MYQLTLSYQSHPQNLSRTHRMTHTPGWLQNYSRDRGALVRWITGLVGCRDEARDIVDEAYVRAVETGVRVRGGNPYALVSQIAWRIGLDRMRRRATRARYQDVLLEVYEPEFPMPDPAEFPPGRGRCRALLARDGLSLDEIDLVLPNNIHRVITQ